MASFGRLKQLPATFDLFGLEKSFVDWMISA